MSRILKLLVLLAVMVMPLRMATAASAHDAHTFASMPMEHCPDQAPPHDLKGGLAACAMACSAALPAMDQASSSVVPIAFLAAAPSPIASLDGIQPETATPPPKRP